MLNINLQHLKVISAIEKEGSMTRAAETLYISQSALSHHVQELEKKIGAKVFERRNKKLYLTAVGKKMMDSAEVVLTELQKLGHEIQSIKAGNYGTINISTECYTTYSWLPRIITKYHQMHPRVTVKIADGATRAPLTFLQDGTLDVALVSRPANQSMEDHPTFKFTPVFQDELVVIMSKAHPLSKRKILYPKDFREQTLICYDVDDKENDLVENVLKPDKSEPAHIIKMPLTEVILEMVQLNFGIAVMAKWLIASQVSDDMTMLPLQDNFSKRTWYLVTLVHQHQLQKDFISFARKELRNLPKTAGFKPVR
ncbi:LysR family transcriptional regulator, regulator for metE and metH [Chitinophaga jiangningensis]|uniref:LysR family transcriptional regulator, regulator for metE and metH n=1 Tax=Chitinophaga jiangningensis TaxID=1419482 RepID=A0A1M6V7W3_9BACT|nr:LysR family transcriptional regulator [Chitinophaga jiangningensis]SHK77559.1 LysR family transcriptional regulator, regulator for metE and metH [Chitinophaga jiangningensis]